MSKPTLEELAERFHELAYRVGLGHWTLTITDGTKSEEAMGAVASMEGDDTFFLVSGDARREEFDIDCFIDNFKDDTDLDLEMTHELVHVLLEEATPDLELDDKAIEPVVHRIAKLLTSLGFAE